MVLKPGHLASQPHQFDVAARLALKLPARGQLMQVSINIELEHRARRVAGSAGRCRLHTRETELGQIEFISIFFIPPLLRRIAPEAVCLRRSACVSCY